MAKTTAPRWSKGVLIPFWIIQLLFMCILLGVQIWIALDVLVARRRTGILELIICVICIVLDVTEIVLFARGSLRSLTYLVLQCVKTALWVVVFLITVVGVVGVEGYIRGSDEGVEVVLLSGVVEGVVLLLTYVASLIYASVIHHRHCRSTSALDHNGPYTTLGIVEANYSSGYLPQPSQPQPQHQLPSPLQEADGGSPPRYEAGRRREGEVHELAAYRSARSLKAR